MTTASLTRLLQLASPALPVGAYTYSQGLEWAVESGIVHHENSALAWISDVALISLIPFELPMLSRFYTAWSKGEMATVETLNAAFLASRESAELHAETLQMGHSLRKLITDLPGFEPRFLAQTASLKQPAYLTLWSGVAQAWGVSLADARHTWLFSWAENQVMAAIKTIPLGQAAGQRILWQFGETLKNALPIEDPMLDAALSNFAPGLAIASAKHETQYSRLFRS